MVMKTIHVKVPEEQLRSIDRVVEERHYPSRSEFVREALRDELEEDFELSEKVKEDIRQAREEEGIPLEEVKKELGIK
ncbi:MAG: ribbon-helix-helix domain-containing protein [Candidatus Nanohaloarchaea archaeon]|nr:ribbon-helix-helix domain-containing protein [Candidatus Nanohaloarchaea archaeon]